MEYEGYEVTSVPTAEQALEALARKRVAVGIIDVKLPGRDGLWLTSQVRDLSPDTAVILATGVTDFHAAVTGLRHGAVDYIVKPLDPDRLSAAVGRAVDWHRQAVDLRERCERLEHEVHTGNEELMRAIVESHANSNAALETILRMLSLHAPAAYRHAHRVARLSVEVARRMGVPESDITDVENGALLHDIGKIATPESILRKAGPLNAQEWEIVRQHPQLGYEMVSQIPFLRRAAEFVLSSHENYDGSGYPAGLAGQQIPFGSRIIAVADAFDVMTERGSYRSRRTVEAATEELIRCRGSQFDSEAVDALLLVLAGDETLPQTVH
jgi:putative nucleotidyltransferase with HDIG domain